MPVAVSSFSYSRVEISTQVERLNVDAKRKINKRSGRLLRTLS